MPNIAKVFYLEWKSQQMMSRIVEPMVMDDKAQASAYHNESLWGNSMDSIHLFHMCQISKLLSPGDKVIDLACGTADLLLKIAKVYPENQFLGVDLSDEMLEKAREAALEMNIKNVEFKREDICELSSLSDDSFDVVFSTMALHQIPDVNMLRKTAQSINRILKRKGGLYISDFIRLKSIKSVEIFFNDRLNSDPIFATDYRNSLNSAFSKEEILKNFWKYINKVSIKIKSSRLFDFVFCVTNLKSRNTPWSRKYINHLPLKKISWQGFKEFLLLKVFMTKTLSKKKHKYSP